MALFLGSEPDQQRMNQERVMPSAANKTRLGVQTGIQDAQSSIFGYAKIKITDLFSDPCKHSPYCKCDNPPVQPRLTLKSFGSAFVDSSYEHRKRGMSMALNTTYGMPARATMSECGTVLTALRHLIENNSDVVVTCDTVETVDLAMLQVLISARKTAERDNKRFSVISGGNGTFDARLSEYGICFSQSA